MTVPATFRREALDIRRRLPDRRGQGWCRYGRHQTACVGVTTPQSSAYCSETETIVIDGQDKPRLPNRPEVSGASRECASVAARRSRWAPRLIYKAGPAFFRAVMDSMPFFTAKPSTRQLSSRSHDTLTKGDSATLRGIQRAQDLSRIATVLNERGIKTARGGNWSSVTLKRVILRAHKLGLLDGN